jgi:hypothetical protein
MNRMRMKGRRRSERRSPGKHPNVKHKTNLNETQEQMKSLSE